MREFEYFLDKKNVKKQTSDLNIDILRQQKNGIKYYGEDATIEEAKNALKIAEKN